MNFQLFHNWLDNPHNLDAASLPVLEGLMKEFPYSQAIETLFLLNLKKENDYRLGKQLRRAAAYAPDRARLKEWMEWMEMPPHDQQREGNSNVIHDAEQLEGEKFLEEEKRKIKEIEDMIQDSLTEIEEKRNRLRLLFEEKKTLLSKQNMETTPEEDDKGLHRPLPKDELLDDFLKQQNLTRKGTFFDPVEKARKSLEDEGLLISETLARLLASQGKINKAVKIYRQLMLNNPEKSGYFAAQIENLKKNLKD
jgi:hypothetical protein